MVASAGALIIAGRSGFHVSYLTMAALVGVGIVTTLLVREPPRPQETEAEREQRVLNWVREHAHLPAWVQRAGASFFGPAVGAVVDFFGRYGAGARPVDIRVHQFVPAHRLRQRRDGEHLLYRPRLLARGGRRGRRSSSAGLRRWLGAVVGGLVSPRWGAFVACCSAACWSSSPTSSMDVRCVRLSAADGLCAERTARFLAAHMHARGPATNLGLSFIVGFDNLALGVHGTALIAFMSSLTSAKYTATQYAVLSSLYALPGKLLMGTSGLMVDALGYGDFYLYAAMLSIPGLLLLLWLSRRDISVARN
jgi:PAT family beta-lactamase induction signal transducer AmpG